MTTAIFEWDDRTHYVLTELILTILNLTVLNVIVLAVAIVIITHLRRGKSFFTSVRPLLETIYSEYIGFVPSLLRRQGEDKVDVVFNGYQEKTFESLYKSRKGRRFNAVRLWVRVYFIILAGIIVLWTISIFSYSLFYEKSSSCSDISREDTDHTCFQLSHREDVPGAIQDIIDRYPGEIVPCEEINDFIRGNNITYDLEVICYHYEFDMITAFAISYGSLKTLSYVISLIITAILETTNKCCSRKKGKTGLRCCPKVSKTTFVSCQVLLTLCSILIVSVFATGMALLHNVPATENSSFDYLRGDTYAAYATVAVYIPLTIFYTIGLFPWWAFKSLDEPLDWETEGLSNEQISKRLNYIVHYVVLHERFSTDYIYEAENGVVIAKRNTTLGNRNDDANGTAEVKADNVSNPEFSEIDAKTNTDEGVIDEIRIEIETSV